MVRLHVRILAVLLAAAGLSLTACLPKRSVCWSPDGKYAAFVAQQKAYLADADGQLSEPLEGVAGPMAWFADSRRIVLVRVVEMDKWEQMKDLFSKQQRKKILDLGPVVRREVLAYEGDWDGWRPPSAAGLTDVEFVALWIYMRQYHAEGLSAKLADKWEGYAKLKLSVANIQIAEVQSGKLVPGKIVAQLPGIGPLALRVSPDGTRIAYTVPNPEIEAINKLRAERKKQTQTQPTNPDSPSIGNLFPQGATLMLVNTDGRSTPRAVAGITGWYPEFTPDSKSLVYAFTDSVPTESAIVLGSIGRAQIVDAPDGPNVLTPQPLAGILYFPFTRITCLNDGQILFSAYNVTLPSAGGLSGDLALFSLAPERRATVAPMISDAARKGIPAEGFAFGAMDLRPDAAAMTFNDAEGTIGYCVFATSAVETINKPVKDVKILDQATWRTNDELSFVVGAGHEWGSKERPEFVLYNLVTKQARCISRAWPDEVMKSFDTERKTTSRPESEPDSVPAEPSQE